MSDHKHERVQLKAEGLAIYDSMNAELTEHIDRTNVLMQAAFRRGTKEGTVELFPGSGVFLETRVPDDTNINVCPDCTHMLIHTLRETADVLEALARKLELKEPAFDQWQRPEHK